MNIAKRFGETVAAIAVAAGLCGGAQAQQTPQANDIVVGAAIVQTGPYAVAGIPGYHALSAVFNEVNEKGGIHGRKFRLIQEDTGYKTDVAVAAFKKVTSQNKVTFYYGDSSAFSKTINPELTRMSSVVLAGWPHTTEINDPAKYPFQFMAGPDYSQMFDLLLKYVAKEKPKAKVAFIYADNENGRDPIPRGKETVKRLGLELVADIAMPLGTVDVTTEAIKLRRAEADYVLFQGFVSAPIPQYVAYAKQNGMKTKFLGSFYMMDVATWLKAGEVMDGFMGVFPYNFPADPTAKGPWMDKYRSIDPKFQNIYGMQSYMTARLYVEMVRRTLDAGKELTAQNLKAAFYSIKDLDTGGFIGVPVSAKGNSIPIGRIYRFDYKAQGMVGVSDWIKLD